MDGLYKESAGKMALEWLMNIEVTWTEEWRSESYLDKKDPLCCAG